MALAGRKSVWEEGKAQLRPIRCDSVGGDLLCSFLCVVGEEENVKESRYTPVRGLVWLLLSSLLCSVCGEACAQTHHEPANPLLS